MNPLAYLRETRGADTSTSARILCNKLCYPLARLLAPAPPISWMHSRWHWYRFPFSLRDRVMWSRVLNCWFRPSDETAIETMLRLEVYEPVDWLRAQAGDVVLDVGAYTGWYTLRMSCAVGATGRVIALEPDNRNRRQLQANLELNGIRNAVVVDKAAWSSNGPLGWETGEIPVWHRARSGSAAQVEGITLDGLAAELGLQRVDWIKMDIEGGEVEALRGARHTLERFRPRLFIEVHETLAGLKAVLAPLGYAVTRSKFRQLPDRHGWILMEPVERPPTTSRQEVE